MMSLASAVPAGVPASCAECWAGDAAASERRRSLRKGVCPREGGISMCRGESPTPLETWAKSLNLSGLRFFISQMGMLGTGTHPAAFCVKSLRRGLETAEGRGQSWNSLLMVASVPALGAGVGDGRSRLVTQQMLLSSSSGSRAVCVLGTHPRSTQTWSRTE